MDGFPIAAQQLLAAGNEAFLDRGLAPGLGQHLAGRAGLGAREVADLFFF